MNHPGGQVSTCCKAMAYAPLGHLQQNSLEEVWNSSNMKNIRKQMLAGQPLKQCEHCYWQEQRGGVRSVRQESNLKRYGKYFSRVEQTQEDGSISPPPLYLDIAFSNKCNLKCHICSDEYSSKWHSDYFALTGEKSKWTKIKVDPDQLLDQVFQWAPYLERISFSGGEPFLSQHHLDLLNFLIAQNLTHIELNYNSNFSTFFFKGTNIFERLSHFKHLIFCASLDGMGPQLEYLRSGISWSKILDNRKKLKEYIPDQNFYIYLSVSIHNCFHIPLFLEYMLETEFCYAQNIFVNLVINPLHMSLQALPSQIKMELEKKYYKAMKRLLQNYDYKKAVHIIMIYKTILGHMFAEDRSDLFAHFLKLVSKVDQIRNEKFSNCFPEFAKHFKNDGNYLTEAELSV